MEDIEHILTCSICMGLFENPRQLPCQHTFCEKCLSDYIRSNTKNKSKTKSSFTCPLCRAKTVLSEQPSGDFEFPLNFTIQSLLDSKELMRAVEKGKLPEPKDKITSASVISKIQKKLFTRSKYVQTDAEETTCQTKVKRLTVPSKSLRLDKNNSNELNKQFCSQYFTFQNVPNLYQIVLERLMGPLLSPECRSLRKAMTITLIIFVLLFYLLLALFSIAFEWDFIFVNISILSLATQLFFVRLKFDITMIKSRVFAGAGFLMIYVATFCKLGLLFWSHALNASIFVIYQKYGFSFDEQMIFTSEGLRTVLVRKFNATLDIESETRQNERKKLFTDFITYTNAFCKKFWNDLYEGIYQYYVPFIILVSFIEIVRHCVEGVWSFTGRRQNSKHVIHARRRRTR